MSASSGTMYNSADATVGDDFSVYLGNISPNIPRKELIMRLVSLFHSLGIAVEAKNIEVNRRGRRPVFCFVPTRNEYEQQIAIGNLHNSDKLHIAVRGKTLSVNKKIPKKTKPLSSHSSQLSPRKLPPLTQRSLPETPSESFTSEADPVTGFCPTKGEASFQKFAPPVFLAKENVLSPVSEESGSETDNCSQLSHPQTTMSAQEISYYFVGQRLNSEDRLTEYKTGGGGYIKNNMRDHIAKYLCAFLNSEGGRLLIGVSNDCLVHGVPCDRRQEDWVRLKIDETIKCFNPPVFPDRYSVRFVPVFNQITGSNLQPSENNLKVIEISVNSTAKPLNMLYENNKGQVFIRRDGSVQGPLKASQILEWCRLHFVDKHRGSKERLEKEVEIVKGECQRKQEEIEMNLKLVSELSKQKDFVEGQHRLKEEEFLIREMHLKAELEVVKRERNKKSTVCSII